MRLSEKNRLYWFVGAAFSRDHLGSRLEAAPTADFKKTLTFRVTTINKMPDSYSHILIIADLEGSSGCWNYASSAFMTDDWCRACLEMSRDVNEVVGALFDAGSWRSALAQAAVQSLSNRKTKPYEPLGPFDARVTLRDGEAEAARLARRWKVEQQGAQIRIRSASFRQLYLDLIRLCYLTPAIEKVLPLALAAFNLKGRIGIIRARRRLKGRLKRSLP